MDYLQEIKDRVNPNLVYNPVLGFCLPELIQKALEVGMITKTEFKENIEWRVLNKELYSGRQNVFKELKITEAINTLKQDPLSEIPF